jgi:hypothetical protein
MMSGNGSAQMEVQAAPQPFHSKTQCEAVQAEIEKTIKEMPNIKGYSLKCVEIKKDDVKVNGKDS